MINENDFDEVGYGKPPKRSRFAKGKSGNPKGRPKESQNFATILAKAGRQRIIVTENGRSRSITKFEASMLQLLNKAVSGDLKAIRQLLYLAEVVETGPDPLAELVAEMKKQSKLIGRPENSILPLSETTETERSELDSDSDISD